MKKTVYLLFLFLFLCLQTIAAEEVKDEMYYKRQIQNQRFIYGTTGIINATKQGRTDVIQNFILAGFDMDTKYAWATMPYYAILYKKSDILDEMLKSGADPNKVVPALVADWRSTSLLIMAIEKKNSDCVKALIDNKVDVNMQVAGKTPLNYAITKKQGKIVEMLLEAGATPDDKTKKLVNKSKDEYLKSLFE